MNEIIQIITFGIALLGAVLGIINTVYSINKDKVKLKLIPGYAIPIGGADPNITFYLQITNLSTFPVIINEIGFKYRSSTKRKVITNPNISDQKGFPRKMESRTSISAYFCKDDLKHQNYRIKFAYVRTACGILKKANSRSLQHYSKEINR